MQGKTLIGFGGVIGVALLSWRENIIKKLDPVQANKEEEAKMLIERVIDADNKLVIGIITPGGYQGARILGGYPKKLIGCSRSNSVLVYTFEDGSWLRIYKDVTGNFMYVFKDAVDGYEYTKKIDQCIISGYKCISMHSGELDAIGELH